MPQVLQGTIPPAPDTVQQDPTEAEVRAVRSRDLDRWQRELMLAEPERLELRREDTGRLYVQVATVKAAAGFLRAFMDGPGKPDPGTNARPGRDALATALDISPRQADHALRALVQGGFLIQTATGHTGQRATFAAALPADLAGVLPLDVEETEEAVEAPVDTDARERVTTRAVGESACHGTRESVSRHAPTSAVPPKPPPRARTRETHRQPPLVAQVQGEGQGLGRQTDDHLQAVPDVPNDRQPDDRGALEELVDVALASFPRDRQPRRAALARMLAPFADWRPGDLRRLLADELQGVTVGTSPDGLARTILAKHADEEPPHVDRERQQAEDAHRADLEVRDEAAAVDRKQRALDDARARLDALDDDDRQQLEAEARAQHPPSVYVPEQMLALAMVDLLDERERAAA